MRKSFLLVSLAMLVLACPFLSAGEETMSISSGPSPEKSGGASPNAFIENMLPSAPKASEPDESKPIQAEAKQRRGKEIVIPQEAVENKDISFLEGCWVSEWKRSSEWSNRVHFMSQDRLCFNRNGEGSLTVTARQGKNNVFRGKAKAHFSGKKIVIKTGTAKGRNGEVWTPSTLELEGTGRSSICYHVAVNPANPKHVRRSKYRLFRE